MDKVKTGILIKEARIKKGYTQRELGDIVGVTNKAVSRWENGDAFPDVALLDIISNTLDISIEEIVLGETKIKESNVVATEIVQLARMEKNRNNRLMLKLSICMVAFLIILIMGVSSMINDMNTWVLYVGCAISTLGLCIYEIISKELSFMKQDITSKAATIISGISVVYSILLIAFSSKLYMDGVRIIEGEKLGPFLNWQLIIIFLINIGIALLYVIRRIVMSIGICFGMYLSVGGIFLCLSYSDMLHRLIDTRGFWTSFHANTLAILIIVCIGYMATLIVNRICRNSYVEQ